MKTVIRSASYLFDLEDIDRYIARSNPAEDADAGDFGFHHVAGLHEFRPPRLMTTASSASQSTCVELLASKGMVSNGPFMVLTPLVKNTGLAGYAVTTRSTRAALPSSKWSR